MGAEAVISVEGLGKSYVIRHEPRHDTLRDALAHGARGALRRLVGGTPAPSIEEFWALRDVSFEVNRGEVMGVIGQNGAGKSTLLKILSRITEPTLGVVQLEGRVASLLEVGTGFHPELSGRENIFLNGAMLGMSWTEVRRKFDEIVAFAEVERFLDTPVKRYSSGMYVRLAFSVAAHVEPDILVVDEVLAVGDAQFQKKCIGKMGDVARQGRTVLLVSHNLNVVQALADRCLVLRNGLLSLSGSPSQAIQHYLESASGSHQKYEGALQPDRPFIRQLEVLTSDRDGIHKSSQPLRVRFAIEMPMAREGMCLSFQIVNQYQQPVVHAWIFDPERPFCRLQGVNKWECLLPGLSLNVGNYTLRAFLSEPPGGRNFEELEHVCPFEVIKVGSPPLFGFRPDACAYLARFEWDHEQ